MEGFFGRERVGAQYHQRGADGCQRVLPVYALGGTDRAAAPAAEAAVPGQRTGADAEGIYAAGADGGEAGEKPAVTDYAEHLRDRDPDLGTAVSDSGGAAHRAGQGRLQGEKQGCADPERAEADADAVCEGKGDPVGPGFCHKKGRPVDRSNVWHEMKKLCQQAGVNARKVFPHNLRHLFAVTFYRQQKDLAKLADILGHSSIETTRIYAMESGAEHQRMINALHLTL